jgi:peptidoglycan/xylan/chitin deacetylase (PgdA/CDA1 family)
LERAGRHPGSGHVFDRVRVDHDHVGWTGPPVLRTQAGPPRSRALPSLLIQRVEEPAGDTSVTPPDAGQPAQGPAQADQPGGKRLCLTFDDGPQLGTTDVLDALAGRIPATFFLNGENIESEESMAFNVGEDQQKTLVDRMLGEDHRLGNHTLHHKPTRQSEYEKAYGKLSDAERLAKLQEAYQTNIEHFERVVGGPVPGLREFARLPGQGKFMNLGGEEKLVKLTRGLGMAHVSWDFEFGANGEPKHLPVHDWKKLSKVDATFTRFPNANDIVLMHDRNWNGRSALLAQVLKKLEANGFTFGHLTKEGTCG